VHISLYTYVDIYVYVCKYRLRGWPSIHISLSLYAYVYLSTYMYVDTYKSACWHSAAPDRNGTRIG